MTDFFITGCATLSPYARLADFPAGPMGELPKADLTILERSLRRGLSDVTRYFMHVAQGALSQAAVAPAEVHVVFGSTYGEIATAEVILRQAFDENDASPARFRNSVHNTAPGLFSISTRNTLPSSAISAGWNTVSMGLLEAQTLLLDAAKHVLLVFAEEAVPEALATEKNYGPLAAAFVLSTAGERSLARVSAVQFPSAAGEVAPGAHPLGPALQIARAIEQREQARITLGHELPISHVDIDARVPVGGPRPLSQSPLSGVAP
jgi:hypothetical protein